MANTHVLEAILNVFLYERGQPLEKVRLCLKCVISTVHNDSI